MSCLRQHHMSATLRMIYLIFLRIIVEENKLAVKVQILDRVCFSIDIFYSFAN